MSDFENFLSREENALFSKMQTKDAADQVYNAVVDTAVKWQAKGFRERAKKYAKNLLSEVILDNDDESLLEKVIARANIITACKCL